MVDEGWNVAPVEMARTFNCGVGMVIVVGAAQRDAALKSLKENGEEAFVMDAWCRTGG